MNHCHKRLQQIGVGLLVCLVGLSVGCTGLIGEPTHTGTPIIVDAIALHGATATAREVQLGDLVDDDGTVDTQWSAQFVLDSGKSLGSLEEDTGVRTTYVLRLSAADPATDDVAYRRIAITFFE